MKNVLVVLVVLGLLGAGAFYFGFNPVQVAVPEAGLMRYAASAGAARAVPGGEGDVLENIEPVVDYENARFGFGLKMPEGFSTQEMPDSEGVSTIVLQNRKGQGIQILITPLQEAPRELTEAMVRRDIPDMQVTDVQVVEVGEKHRGIAFLSDNEAFNGASREVWFFFRGNLYQISTYAHLDTLLQEMFATWQFQ